MLRAELQESEKALTVALQGRFAGDDAEYIRKLVMRSNLEPGLVVDLTEITFVDSVGEATLSLFGRVGARFLAGTAYTLDVCQRLRLPLVRNGHRKSPSGQAERPSK